MDDFLEVTREHPQMWDDIRNRSPSSGHHNQKIGSLLWTAEESRLSVTGDRSQMPLLKISVEAQENDPVFSSNPGVVSEAVILNEVPNAPRQDRIWRPFEPGSQLAVDKFHVSIVSPQESCDRTHRLKDNPHLWPCEDVRCFEYRIHQGVGDFGDEVSAFHDRSCPFTVEQKDRRNAASSKS